MLLLLKIVGYSALIALFVFLFGAFVSASFDVTTWNGDGRALVALMWLVGSVAVAGLLVSEER